MPTILRCAASALPALAQQVAPAAARGNAGLDDRRSRSGAGERRSRRELFLSKHRTPISRERNRWSTSVSATGRRH